MTEIQTPRGAVVTVQTGNGKTTAKLVWNPNFASKYTAKFDKVQKFIDSECLRYSDKLVPMKTGMLKKSETQHNYSVTYSTPAETLTALLSGKSVSDDLYSICLRYLGRTGLMYRGCD